MVLNKCPGSRTCPTLVVEVGGPEQVSRIIYLFYTGSGSRWS